MGNRRCSDVEIARFSFKLQQLLEAGISLLQSFRILDSSWSNVERQRYRTIEKRLREGQPLANVLRSVSFPSFFCSLIAFSEKHGGLSDTLAVAHQYYSKKNQRKKQLRKILTYPVLVLVSSSVTITLIMLFLLPQFNSLYGTLGIPTPFLIQFAGSFVLSEGAKGRFLLILLILCIMGIGLACCLKKRDGVTRIMLRMVFLSRLVRLHYNQLISTQVAMLLEAGIPILEICQLFYHEAPSEFIRRAFYQIELELRKGKSLSVSFRVIPWFLPELIELLAIAEQSGRVSTILGGLGDQLEQELDEQLNRAAVYMENILLVATGTTVFFMLFSLFYPLVNVIGQI